MTSIRKQILELAHQHGLAGEALSSAELKAEALAKLSDNELPFDLARLALVRLRMAKVLNPQQGHDWLLRLHDEENELDGVSR